MIPITSAEHLRRIDAESIEEDGLPGSALMESAGAQAALMISELLEDRPGTLVDIFCGPGNNGGDGFVIARHLLNRNYGVRVFCTQPYDRYRGDAATMLSVLRRCGVEPTCIEAGMCEHIDEAANLIVDALLGIGTKGPARSTIAEIIEWINHASASVFSIDIASGLEADQPEPKGPAVQADITLSIGALKCSQVFYPGNLLHGHTTHTPIGFPPHRLEECSYQMPDWSELALHWPRRALDGHKGEGGKVLVLAGSPGMMGAARLCAEAALVAGASMVQVACPTQLQAQVDHPSLMTLPLEGDDLQPLIERLPWCDAVVIGPGLGSLAARWLPTLMPHLKGKATVLDADALNALAEKGDLLQHLHQEVVLTPHEGEARRLFGDIPSPGFDRLSFGSSRAHDLDCVLHLKGAPSITFGPSGEGFVNRSGGPALSTAGSGDVLAGIVGSLMARSLSSTLACLMGAHFHGKLVDDLAASGRRHGITSRCLIHQIPHSLDKEA